MKRKLRSTLTLVAGLSLLAAACGDDDDADLSGDPTDAPADATDAPADGTTAPADEGDGEDVTLTLLIDNTEVTVAQTDALTQAFTELHPNITFDIEQRPGGGDGDNIVKTRLATGEMSDVFFYNSGSLLQALNPEESILDLTGDPMLDNVVEAFFPSVTQNDKVFGVPFGTGMGGGILYSRKIYEENGLTVPTTWEEFAANNDALLAAWGITPGWRLVRRRIHVDLAAVRPRRLLQRHPGGADVRRGLHREQGEVHDDPRRGQGLRTLARRPMRRVGGTRTTARPHSTTRSRCWPTVRSRTIRC